MLAKNIFGVIILLLNATGLGFILYLVFQSIINHLFPHTEATPAPVPVKKQPFIINDDILPDEDDLLKDMDLSDLDNLNLDDFE